MAATRMDWSEAHIRMIPETKSSPGPLAWLFLPAFILRPSLDQAFGLVNFNLGPVTFSPGFAYNLMILGLALALGVRALLFDKTRQRHVASILLAWGPFFFFAIIAELHSPNPIRGLQPLFNYLIYISISYIALEYGEEIDAQQLTRSIFLCGVIPISYGLIHALFHFREPNFREASTFTHPNIFAFFLMIYSGFLLHAYLSFSTLGSNLKRWLPFAIFLSILLIMLAGTRSALLGSAAFITAYSLIRKPIIIVPIAAVTCALLLVPAISHRILSDLNQTPGVSYARFVATAQGNVDESGALSMDSGLWRRYLWVAAWPWITRNPIAGYGLSSFSFYIPKFFPLRETNGAAHNDFIQMMFEGGAFFVIAYFNIFFVSIFKIFKSFGKFNASSAYVALASMAFWIVSFTDNVIHYLTVTTFFWFIIFSMRRSLRKPSRRNHFPARQR